MIKKIKEVWYIPVVIASVVLVNLFVCRVGMTIGNSMYPTLHNRYPILINITNTIKRKEIIVFKNNPEDGYLVKRVIGLPGETVQIKNNIIYINDKPITDAVNVQMNDYGLANEKITLGEDEYFVMGDNRNNSYDSRKFGPIPKDCILGTVHYSLIPFKQVY